jgi:shikimate kinase
VDRALPSARRDAPGREGGTRLKGEATCFGAGTIVNAIATGRGAAFALALRATATATFWPEDSGVLARVPSGIDPALVRSAARRVLERGGKEGGLEVAIDSEIPMSRGLKSSSAVANAVVEASARALDLQLDPSEVLRISVDAAFDAGVTITGAFDDASASLLGGLCITDNRARRILALDRLPQDLVSVVWIPRRTIPKARLKGIDFRSIRPLVEEAFHLALRGDYFRAMELNSRAYAPLLGVDEAPAARARAAGAVAAGITGAGPAIVALAKLSRAEAVHKAMDDGESEVRIVGLHTIESREVML